jgi:hypothetical protein
MTTSECRMGSLKPPEAKSNLTALGGYSRGCEVFPVTGVRFSACQRQPNNKPATVEKTVVGGCQKRSKLGSGRDARQALATRIDYELRDGIEVSWVKLHHVFILNVVRFIDKLGEDVIAFEILGVECQHDPE